jgi:hypothetical protein
MDKIGLLAREAYLISIGSLPAARDEVGGRNCGSGGRKRKIKRFFLFKVSHPFAVAVLKETVYWDDWTRKAVFQADKNSGTSISILKDNMPGQSLENK